jgi:NAD(P)-dependent dehydrogenase (short-subunit alcohol dehydrogenase family)
MRDLHSDLTGRTALVTGGWVKIGYQLVLRLLQDGARVNVTTRFPHAAAHRFSLEPGFEQWARGCSCNGSTCATCQRWKRSRLTCWKASRS